MRRVLMVAAVLALLVGACGDSDDGDSGGDLSGGEERVVLVDYHHDEFASAFLRYYPERVTVRPGDRVTFKQAWTGEPHSVTMGTRVDEIFELLPQVSQYDGPEEAEAAGLPKVLIDRAVAAFGSVPGMTGDGFEINQVGAKPCFVDAGVELPVFSDIRTGAPYPDADCPPGSDDPKPFTGTEPLYNSGFIAPTGRDANRFEVPIAADADPGTYAYFCNYHWTSMQGTIEIVDRSTEIPTQQEVNRTARREIDADAGAALKRVEAAAAGSYGARLQPPLAGRASIDDEEPIVIINEFLPKKHHAKVDEPVTWTVDGVPHTVSFNVPRYFPVFDVGDDGRVTWNPKSYEPVAWDVPETDQTLADEGNPDDVARVVDVGTWDGKGGFHSSGVLNPGDTFSVTFTRAGTYPYACVLHPQMVGTLVVEAD